MCTLYAIKGLFEGYLGYRLSTTYAHLALAASGFTLVNDGTDLKEFLQSEGWYEDQSKNWNAIISDPILAFGSFGILAESEFPSELDRNRFRELFGKPLDAQGIQDFVKSTLAILVEAIRAAKANKAVEADLLFKEFKMKSHLLIEFTSKFKPRAMKNWNANFSKVSFTHVLSIKEDMPGTPEEGNEALNRMFNRRAKELGFVGKYSHRVVKPEQLLNETVGHLARGEPAVLAIEHRDDGGHVVLGIDVESSAKMIVCRDTACFTNSLRGFREIAVGELLKPNSSALLLQR